MATQMDQQIARLREIFGGGIGNQFQMQERWNETGGESSSGYYSPYATNARLLDLLNQHGLASKTSLDGPGALGTLGTLDPRSVQKRTGVTGEFGVPIGDQWRTVSGDEFSPGSGWQSGPIQWGSPTGYSYTLDPMKNPDRGDKQGAYSLAFNPDGSLKDVTWQNYEMSKGFLGDNMSWLGPLLVGGLGALGASVGGAAGAGGGAAAEGALGGLTADQVALNQLIENSLARDAIVYGGAGGSDAIGALAQNALARDALAQSWGGVLGDVGQAAIAPQLGGQAQAPIEASKVSSFGKAATAGDYMGALAEGNVAPVARAMMGPESGISLLKTGAQLAGPTMSLLSGVSGLQAAAEAQDPSAPRLPGIEAPAEARGYQPGSAPILDVLGRNRSKNKNGTLLTGPGGINMDSVRVRGNTLLGL